MWFKYFVMSIRDLSFVWFGSSLFLCHLSDHCEEICRAYLFATTADVSQFLCLGLFSTFSYDKTIGCSGFKHFLPLSFCGFLITKTLDLKIFISCLKLLIVFFLIHRWVYHTLKDSRLTSSDSRETRSYILLLLEVVIRVTYFSLLADARMRCFHFTFNLIF